MRRTPQALARAAQPGPTGRFRRPGTAYADRVTLRIGHWHLTSRSGAPVRTQDRPSA